MKNAVIALGTMYLDINCINFPFDNALYANRETVGEEYHLDVGGSALNFSRMIRRLGLETILIGKIGQDMTGKALEDLVKQNKITSAFTVDKNVQTNIAVHYIHADGTSIMSSCGTANQNIDYDSVIAALKKHVNSCRYFYIGGFFKLKSLLPELPRLLQEIKKNNKNIQIVLDHGRVTNMVTKEIKGILYKLFPSVDIYLPSYDEFLDVWKANTLKDGIVNMNNLSKPLTVIKQGEKGAVGVQNAEIVEISSFKLRSATLNTVGAGDSFNAGFIAALSEGKSFEESIRFANATAAIKISQITAPMLNDVTSFLQGNLPDKLQTK